MTRKQIGGFILTTYKGDHPPVHVHIEKNGKETGRWDIEHQSPMDNFELSQKLSFETVRLHQIKERK